MEPITTAITLKATWDSLSGLFGGGAKDEERKQRTDDAYRMAMSGNQNALEFLKYMSGRFGTTGTLGYPYEGQCPCGGWATDKAKEYSYRLYQAVLNSYGMGPEEHGGNDGTIPIPSDRPQGLPPMVTTASMSYGPLLLLGVGVVLAGREAMKRRRS